MLLIRAICRKLSSVSERLSQGNFLQAQVEKLDVDRKSMSPLQDLSHHCNSQLDSGLLVPVWYTAAEKERNKWKSARHGSRVRELLWLVSMPNAQERDRDTDRTAGRKAIERNRENQDAATFVGLLANWKFKLVAVTSKQHEEKKNSRISDETSHRSRRHVRI